MFNLRNLSIAKRLTLGFGSIGLALLITAGVSFQGLAVLNRGIAATEAGNRCGTVARDWVNILTRINLTIFQLVTERDAANEGGARVSATVQLLGRIRESLTRFADRTRQISAATAEQSRASQDVALRVEHSVQEAAGSAASTSQMAATTGEIARTAADLAQVADRLRTQVEAFTL